jgi:MoaA/NifB/PqqE/SkfB family radical SAM enzyme
MCTKQSPGCGIVEGDMSLETFDRIVPALSKLEALILNGIDLENYFEVFMRFRKSPEQQRLMDCVNRMKAEALSRGVELHVDRLLKSDQVMLGHVRKVFAEAEEIARASGIDLHLPALVPARTRRCEFIEGGGAFVSWDGNVHPCYFLWHRYQCHIGGLVKYVRPESFGCLADRSMLSIWNDPAFQSFRQGVLKYDFPFCYDCSVALCDYTQFENFEQDCHISRVPCGACLWCTGLFRCLQ